MPTNIVDDPTAAVATIVAPSAGDGGTAATVQAVAQHLGDRTAANAHGGRFAAINWPTLGIASPVTSGSIAINSIAGSGKWWAAVGDDDGGDASVYSAPHASGQWLELGNPSAIDLNSIAWDPVGSVFIAVGDSGSGGGDAYILTIAEGGISNFERVNPKNFNLLAVYVDSTGAAVAAGAYDGTDIYAVRSVDAGVTWAEIAMVGAAGSVVNGIVSSGSTMVAVGQTSGAAPLIWRSADNGATFSVITPPAGPTDALVDVTHDGVNFVAIGDNGEVLTSPTGATWTEATDIVQGSDLVQIDADPIGRVMIVTFASSRFQVSTDGGSTWAEVGHVPMPLTKTILPWKVIAFDGSAWASIDGDSGPSVVNGIQSLAVS